MVPKLQTLDEVIYGPSINELGHQTLGKKKKKDIEGIRMHGCVVWGGVERTVVEKQSGPALLGGLLRKMR